MGKSGMYMDKLIICTNIRMLIRLCKRTVTRDVCLCVGVCECAQTSSTHGVSTIIQCMCLGMVVDKGIGTFHLAKRT